MTNSLERKPNSALSQWRAQRGDDPAWLWWLVAGSSIAAHLLLLSLSFPLSSSLSTSSSSSNPIAIDLIELPPSQTPATAPPPSEPSTTIAAPPTTPAPTAPLPTAPTSPPAPTAGDIAFAPAPSSPLPPPLPSPPPFPTSPPPTPYSSTPPLPTPYSPTPPQPQQPSTTAAPSQPPAIPTSPPTERESLSSPLPSAPPVPPADPSIATLPIDIPVPDVSQQIEIPAESTAPLEQVETPEQVIPVRLTASLTATESDPSAANETETIARPIQETETFTADPTSSPCLITPDVLPYRNRTVAVQVTTNEAGQATDASVRQSSGSPVYDDLAVCLVRQWQFEPATDQGVPVVSDALVVAVRIE